MTMMVNKGSYQMCKKRSIALILSLIITSFSISGCGTHYCSYGGCMNEVEHSGDRCSIHQGLDNDPNYGLPDSMKATGDWYNKE